MAKLDFAGFQKYLSAFDFPRLFVDVLGWNQAPASLRSWQEDGCRFPFNLSLSLFDIVTDSLSRSHVFRAWEE